MSWTPCQQSTDSSSRAIQLLTCQMEADNARKPNQGAQGYHKTSWSRPSWPSTGCTRLEALVQHAGVLLLPMRLRPASALAPTILFLRHAVAALPDAGILLGLWASYQVEACAAFIANHSFQALQAVVWLLNHVAARIIGFTSSVCKA